MTTDPHAGAELTDDALQGEIELVGDLVVAASSSDGPLSDDEIDAALGITRSAGSSSGSASGADGGDDTDDTEDSADCPDSRKTASHGATRGAPRRQHA